MYQALHLAEKQVFITDWWLTPEYYLQRPVNFDNREMEKYRLDNVLAELANDGVKIFIIVYKEVEFAGLYHNSAHTKHTLQSRNPDQIKVLRHPRSFVSLWSHHEKICVIDHKIGFIGGLDICLGRWDTQDHPIQDHKTNNGYLFPGKDYENSYIKSFTKVADYKSDMLDRNTQPRMPWHDVHLMVKGESAVDLGRHFLEYWNHAKFDKEGIKKNETTILRPTKTIKLRKNAEQNYAVDNNTFDIFDEANEDCQSALKKNPNRVSGVWVRVGIELFHS